MFTGIVEEAGIVESVRTAGDGIQLLVRARVCGRGVKIGDSISVNGCCLTVAKSRALKRDKLLQFDLLAETWNLTNFAQAAVGSAVNLERALRVGDRLGGHFVTGHIDGVGKILRWEKSGKDHILEINAPSKLLRHVLLKGSIAVDGISLTVAGIGPKSFQTWIIPHTIEVTALRERRAGALVNLETDLLGKYVERFTSEGR